MSVSFIPAGMNQYGYSIRRAGPGGQPADPCAPLEFHPPRGSDELHEALKKAYPYLPNLKARMSQAVIDFHLAELNEEKAASISPSTNSTPDYYLPSPISSVSTPFTSIPSIRSHASSSKAVQTQSQEQMMTVWSLESNPEAKIHKRRTMTDAEKHAYKQKRKEGACADCKRRRRKVSFMCLVLELGKISNI